MIQIIPAILATTPEDYQQDIEKLNTSESFKEGGWVHIDFMDNEFVPNRSIEVDPVTEYPTHLNKEAHLMVKNPLNWIEKLKAADFKRVIFHIESDEDAQEVIKSIKSSGMEAGVAANPETEVGKLKQLKDLDLILIMGVKPGFQGQPFEENTYDRLKQTSQFFENISIDGAVKDSNAKQLVESGAQILVSGSFILKGDVDENLEKLWEVLNK